MPPPIDAQLALLIAREAYRVPAVTAYNRLEASPRASQFGRSLRAEIRDPLWMLSRQWQFGEFQAEDAASPVTARLFAEHTALADVSFDANRTFPLGLDVPLETRVERERLRGSLWLALQMARMFLRLMRDRTLAGHLGDIRTKYPLQYPIDPNDIDGQQLHAAAAADLFDGFAVHTDIVTLVNGVSRFETWMNDVGMSPADQQTFGAVALVFTRWFARNYSQAVGSETAWLPEQLEYRFEVRSPAPAETTLVAEGYHDGHLDWYSFDAKMARAGGAVGSRPGVSEHLLSFIPSPVTFKGMPHPRFWMFEEGLTDFGALETGTTGLLHLLLAEFGLIYGNDWFLLPYPMDINTLCDIQGLLITDVFGQHTLVRAAGRGTADTWQRWVMFHQTDAATRGDSHLFYLPPSITTALEGEPLESVTFLRDEMANLVWAVEGRVPSQAGQGVNGNEMALERATPAPFVPANDTVRIRYVAGTTVPDNWIPFIPVRMSGSEREIRLQRARLPGAKGALGVLLTERPAPYYVNEEEIPRAGVMVQRAFQRTRWLNGKTLLWIGRYKGAGTGEGWSNLTFDQIVDIPQ